MSSSQSLVWQALRSVIDPDLGQDIVTLGMVRQIEIVPHEAIVKVTLRLTTPLCPLKEYFQKSVDEVIQSALGDQWQTRVRFEMSKPSTFDDIPVQSIWMVASGKGGVGKSTVAFLLAHALKTMGLKVAFLDADVMGPSLPFLIGDKTPFPRIEQRNGQTYLYPIEHEEIQWMSAGFVIEERFPMAWRGPIVSKTLLQLLLNTRWEPADVMLIDLPPGTGDVQLTLLERLPTASAVIVTTPHMLALKDVERTVEMFRLPKFKVKLLGIIENMSYYEPTPGHRYFPFGTGAGEALERTFEIPILGCLPINQAFNQLPVAVPPLLDNFVFLSIVTKALRREGIISAAHAGWRKNA